MRTVKLLLSLCLVASPAFAQRTPARPAPAHAPSRAAAPPLAPPLATIDRDAVPARCHPQLAAATGANLALALQGRMALASCVADARLATLQLVDAHESVLAVDAAVAHSLALYAEVIARGDLITRIVAEHARAELYATMRVRMLATVPPPTPGEAGATLHATRTQILESQLAPWRDEAAAAAERILELVRANPRLARNPVVAHAVRTSQARLRARTRTAAVTPAPATTGAALVEPFETGDAPETLK